MATITGLPKMEVTIPKDILKDLAEPGKTFLHQFNDELLKPQRALSSIVLEKMADDVVKICITVQAERFAVSSAIELQQNEVSNSSQQTENAETKDRLMQTENQVVKPQEEETVPEQQPQLEAKILVDSGFQTIQKEFAHFESQTVEKALSTTFVQTVSKEYVESSFQTDIKEFSDSDAQTDVKEIVVSSVQTDMSLALLCDAECQASTQTNDSECQVEVSRSETSCQATAINSDNFSQVEIYYSECSVQTFKEETVQECQTILSLLSTHESTSQTELSTASCDVQTESSMSLMTEFGCQMAPDTSVSESQTTLDVRTVPSQTEKDIQFAETQTQPDVNNRESQTDELSTICDEGEGTTTEPETAKYPVSTCEEALSQQDVPVAEGDLILPSAAMIESITPLSTGNTASLRSVTIQTDPVTIILGDATFLIEKLKTCGVKAETTKHDIELELAQNGAARQAARSRSGYIPGSRLSGSILSASVDQLNMDHIKATPVKPFNPKDASALLNINEHIKPIDLNSTTPKPRKFIKEPLPTPIVVPQEMARQTTHRLAPTLSERERESASSLELTCPFCDMVFYQSTALYNHITRDHQEQRQVVKPRAAKSPIVRSPRTRPDLGDPDMPEEVRKSVQRYRQMAVAKGVEPPGPKRSRVSFNNDSTSSDGYSSPPVLEPVYRTNVVELVDNEGTKFTPSPHGRTYKRALPASQPEPSLFEDLPEPKRTYPRGRVRREKAAETSRADTYEYECPHCPEHYGSASHLYAHLKRAHKHEMEQQRQAEQHDSDSANESPTAGQAAVHEEEGQGNDESGEQAPTEGVEAGEVEEAVGEGVEEEETVGEGVEEVGEESAVQVDVEDESDQETEVKEPDELETQQQKRKRQSVDSESSKKHKREVVEEESATREDEEQGDVDEPQVKKRAGRPRRSAGAEESSPSTTPRSAKRTTRIPQKHKM